MTGHWDPGVYSTTGAGWWWMKTVCVSAKRECHVCASFAQRSTCPQTNCFCRHQVRQSQRPTTKKEKCFNFNKFKYMNPVLKDLSFFLVQEWKLFLFPWKARLKFTRAIKCVRAKFVVTGELAVLKHLKAAAPGNTVTNHSFHIFHSYQCFLGALLQSTVLLSLVYLI